MKLYEELVRRGLIAQVTDEKEIGEMINEGKATFYIGFDPTADSLHVGHFMALCLMKRLQQAGNKPIALLGGGTGMIGDPSGKSDMRKMMTKETIDHNIACFKKQMSRFIDFSDGKALMVNNADWLLSLNYIDVLREVGACFSVNKMLTFECYKQRMERGLTFLEFNYMIMQSYDFYMLFQKYGCNMQFGGDDQWANMLGGTELIRKKLGKDAHAMTITLLLNSEGKKMGKTEKGAVWLDPDKTSPYEFFQYWRNVADADVIKCLKLLTFVPIEEIEEMERTMEGAAFNQAKERLAFELTKMIHGDDEANKALNAAHSVFGGGGSDENMPTDRLPAELFAEDGTIAILDLLTAAKLVPSKREARNLIAGGGIAVDDKKIDDPNARIGIGDFVIVRKGKKVVHKIVKG
ncbi:MAG: tyrosine--tRNA ligase [Bacteroides sp.]|nr:tyrosine--tRNA ligase [Eubacterium sp.]MCM1419029.1 tyrosine--tRNA ligase [Roseburia sp.]MCM1463550.1 tyrosine--tRNA ligase [Bacteroides sp.]